MKKYTLTPQNRDDLWGEDGPYSEAYLIKEQRILDDSVSRTFLRVEARINPFTFRFVKKHKAHFKNDSHIQAILEHTIYRGIKEGYFINVWQDQYINDSDLLNAEQMLTETREAIIRMHCAVMEMLGGMKSDSYIPTRSRWASKRLSPKTR